MALRGWAPDSIRIQPIRGTTPGRTLFILNTYFWALWSLPLLFDRVIPEPLGGAHRDVPATIEEVRAQILEWIKELKAVPMAQLLDERFEKFRRMGMS